MSSPSAEPSFKHFICSKQFLVLTQEKVACPPRSVETHPQVEELLASEGKTEREINIGATCGNAVALPICRGEHANELKQKAKLVTSLLDLQSHSHL